LVRRLLVPRALRGPLLSVALALEALLLVRPLLAALPVRVQSMAALMR
jgi:hypothetical protein